MYCTRLPTHYLSYMCNNPSRLPTYQPSNYLPLAYLPTHLITLGHIVKFHVYKCMLWNAHVQIIKFTLTHCQGQICKIIGAHCQVYKLFHASSQVKGVHYQVCKITHAHCQISKFTSAHLHTLSSSHGHITKIISAYCQVFQVAKLPIFTSLHIVKFPSL
jgi:hypothetical protein